MCVLSLKVVTRTGGSAGVAAAHTAGHARVIRKRIKRAFLAIMFLASVTWKSRLEFDPSRHLLVGLPIGLLQGDRGILGSGLGAPPHVDGP